jgi:hypothetical protein
VICFAQPGVDGLAHPWSALSGDSDALCRRFKRERHLAHCPPDVLLQPESRSRVSDSCADRFHEPSSPILIGNAVQTLTLGDLPPGFQLPLQFLSGTLIQSAIWSQRNSSISMISALFTSNWLKNTDFSSFETSRPK